MDMVHPEDLPMILDIIAQRYVTLDPSPVTTEYRMRHKDGEYLWFETRDKSFLTVRTSLRGPCITPATLLIENWPSRR